MSIKITIDDKKININDIFISEKNPRFTLLNNLNDDLKNFITSKSDVFSQKNIFEKLLSFEGDFSDLYRLLEKIYNFGFENKNEPIYLVKSGNEYFVAEGNRRIMVLKILLNIFELPNFNTINYKYNSFNKYFNENSDSLSKNEEYSNKNDSEKNFNLCREMIGEIKKKYDGKEWVVYTKLISDSSDIWKSIYDKHLTGERPGMRKWSRSKYFADLLNLFPDGINKNSFDINEKIFKTLFRDIDKIIQDFKESQFIYCCVYFGESLNSNDKVENFSNKTVLEKMISLDRVSSLERTHSFSKIKNIICNNILQISNKKEFDDEFIKISFDSNNRITFKCNRIKLDIFFKFLYEKWKKGIITTRPIREEVKNEFINDINVILLNSHDLNNRMSRKELENIDESKLTKKQLENLVLSNKKYNKIYLNRFISALKIRESNSILKQKILEKLPLMEGVPKFVFKNLYDQLYWNSLDSNFFFFGAVAFTIRSIIEQFVVWFYYFSLENEDEKKDWLINHICGHKTSSSCSEILRKKEDKKRKFSDDKVRRFSVHLLNSNADDKLIDKFIEIFEKSVDISNRNALNEYVHSMHLIHSNNNYDGDKEFLLKNIRWLEFFVKNINFEKLNVLNDEIIKVNKIIR